MDNARAMASNDFDVEHFERRLHTLKDSQESIQGLSAWCLDRRQHHKKIVATWLQVLKKGKCHRHRLIPIDVEHKLLSQVSSFTDCLLANSAPCTSAHLVRTRLVHG